MKSHNFFYDYHGKACHTNNNILLLQMLLLTLVCLQILQLNVVAGYVTSTESQKIDFFTHTKTNGACVDNFVRLWHEELSAEERAHWDGIEGLELKHFDEFINFFDFSRLFEKVTLDTSKFKLIVDEKNPKEAWNFNIYIFKGFSFYFSPTGQISRRDMAKIGFLLAWQRLRLKEYGEKAKGCRFKSNVILPSIYMCKVLDAAFKMPTLGELKAEMARRERRKRQLQGKERFFRDNGYRLISKVYEGIRSKKTPWRTMFQQAFDQLHRPPPTENQADQHQQGSQNGSTDHHILEIKRNAVYNRFHAMDAYLICPTVEDITEAKYILTKFARDFIEKDVQTQTLKFKSYREMEQIFAGNPNGWKVVKKVVYKHMELYSRHLTSFDPYELSELPVQLSICHYKLTGKDMRELTRNDAERIHINGVMLNDLLDTWKPKWLLKAASKSGIYAIEEPIMRIPVPTFVRDEDGRKGKQKVTAAGEESTVMDEQIFMPIDEMDAEHIEFMLGAHERSADWKWSEVEAAPIDISNRNEILAFDIMEFMKAEDDKITENDGAMENANESLLTYRNNTGKNLPFMKWVKRGYQLFKLRHLTTKDGSWRTLSALSEVERLDFAVQIYLRLFRACPIVKKMVDGKSKREYQRKEQFKKELQRQERYASGGYGGYGYRQRYSDYSREESTPSYGRQSKSYNEDDGIYAAQIGRKLMHLIGKWELEQQRMEISVQPAFSCDVTDSVTWIDEKLKNFSSTTTSSNHNLTAASLLLVNDACVEASTLWIRRMLYNFDLKSDYRTSLALKLLGLIRIDTNNIDVNIDFGEESLMEDFFVDPGTTTGTHGRAGTEENHRTETAGTGNKKEDRRRRKEARRKQANDRKMKRMDAKKERKNARETLKKIFASVDTRLWQWAQRRLETMLASLPQKGKALDRQIPEWADKLRLKRRIRRVQYEVELHQLVRLFGYIQLGTLITLNRLVAEQMWKDLVDGTNTLESKTFRTSTDAYGRIEKISALDMRTKFVNNLHSLLNHSYNQPEPIQVMGLQPSAIRPKYKKSKKPGVEEHEQEQEDGKSVHELAKMFEKHEAMGKQMGKIGLKLAFKILTHKSKNRRKKRKRHDALELKNPIEEFNKQLEAFNEGMQDAFAMNPESSPFYMLGQYHAEQAEAAAAAAQQQQDIGGTSDAVSDAIGEAVDWGSIGDLANWEFDLGIDIDFVNPLGDLLNMLPDIGDIGLDFDLSFILDLESIFDTDGLTEIWDAMIDFIGNTFELAKSGTESAVALVQEMDLSDLMPSGDSCFCGGGSGSGGDNEVAQEVATVAGKAASNGCLAFLGCILDGKWGDK